MFRADGRFVGFRVQCAQSLDEKVFRLFHRILRRFSLRRWLWVSLC